MLAAGRMRPVGLAAVEAATADGRWARAYAGPASMTVLEDLADALAADGAAAGFFEGLNKTDRYSVLWRVQAALPRSRARRLESLVHLLAEGKCPRARSEAAVKRKKNAETKKATRRKAAREKGSPDGLVERVPVADDD